MPQWRPAMWRGFRMPIEKGGRAANARERSLRQRHVRAAANGVGGNVAHPGKAIRRADGEGERRAFRQTTTGVGGPHRGVRRARPARGIAHVDGALPAGREPGDGAQRAFGAGGRRLHRAAAHVGRAHPHRRRLPCLRRQPAGFGPGARRGALWRRGRGAAPQRHRARRASGTDVGRARAPDRLPVHRAGAFGAHAAHQADIPHIAVLVPRARRAGDRGRAGVQPPDGLRRRSGPRRAGAGAEVRGRRVHGQDAAGSGKRSGTRHGRGVPRPRSCGWCWTRSCPACRKASWAARTGWA